MRYRSPRSIQAYQVVLADSHGIPRAPHYSGTNPEPRHRGTAYTTITHYGRPSQGVRLPRQHGTTPRQRGNRPAPQHPARNGRRLSHARGLAIIRFRSPLLTEYLFLRVLRCFTSPRSPHHPIHVQMMVAQHNPGRVPPFGHPRIKARSPTPRGISQAATSFISSWCQGIHRMPHKTTHNKKHAHDHHHKTAAPRATRPPHTPHAHAQDETKRGDARRQQRCSQPLYKSQTTHHNHHNPTTKEGSRRKGRTQHTPHQNRRRAAPQRGGHNPPPREEAAPPKEGATGVGREPDSAPVRPQQQSPHAQPHNEDAPHQHTASRTHAPPSTAPPPAPNPRTKRTTRTNGQTAPRTGLPRKEVIQPHLPVRLPCYDFVPIADPTFDHSPQQEPVGPWASGVTNFRDVTGGVYKARERIHRSVADLRLLATPPSWGRVADPNPN